MMIKKLFILLSASYFFALAAEAQVIGKNFPEMETENVDDVVTILPTDLSDKYTLLGLAYSKKAENALKTWFDPVYQKFIGESDNIFAAFSHDIHVYFVPMFTGVNAVAAGKAKKKTAEEMDKRLVPNILFYKGNLKTYKNELELDSKNLPYMFVIDKTGKIVYATSGSYTEQKMRKLEASLED